MTEITKLIKIFKFEFLFWLINSIFQEIPLRLKLLKKRIPGFLTISILFYLFLSHIDYVFFEFAYSETAGKFSIYEQVLQSGASWYKSAVISGRRWLWMMYIAYMIYFIVSSISLSFYAYFAKYKETIVMVYWIAFLIFNNWFTYAYTFYICQINVIVLACFIYNAFYWVFHLIMWDEEMEIYYENQVDLANQGREGFIHKENRTKDDIEESKPLEYYTDETRPDLQTGMFISAHGDKEKAWLKANRTSRFINLKTLEVNKEFEASSAVENVSDLERRYDKHIAKFYSEDLAISEKIKGSQGYRKVPGHVDDMIEFWIVNYLIIFPIRWWEDVNYWKPIYKYDIIRIFFLSLYRYIISGQYRVPKVVGPYSVYSPYYKPNSYDQAQWVDWKFLILFKRLFIKLSMFLSPLQKYQNWRWFLFANKFYTQRKKLIKKRKTLNYRFFKEYS